LGHRQDLLWVDDDDDKTACKSGLTIQNIIWTISCQLKLMETNNLHKKYMLNTLKIMHSTTNRKGNPYQFFQSWILLS